MVRLSVDWPQTCIPRSYPVTLLFLLRSIFLSMGDGHASCAVFRGLEKIWNQRGGQGTSERKSGEWVGDHSRRVAHLGERVLRTRGFFALVLWTGMWICDTQRLMGTVPFYPRDGSGRDNVPSIGRVPRLRPVVAQIRSILFCSFLLIGHPRCWELSCGGTTRGNGVSIHPGRWNQQHSLLPLCVPWSPARGRQPCARAQLKATNC